MGTNQEEDTVQAEAEYSAEAGRKAARHDHAWSTPDYHRDASNSPVYRRAYAMMAKALRAVVQD